MSFEYDLSLIVCPICHSNNENLEVTGLHIFTHDKNNPLPYYEIRCHICHSMFTKNTSLCLKEVSEISQIK